MLVMYIYSVIPLTYIPKQHSQYIHYFSPLLLHTGQLVEVPLSRRLVRAVVFEGAPIQEQKQAIRHSVYSLQKIQSALTDTAVIDSKVLDIVIRTAAHYYEPVSFVLSRALPAHFSKPTKPFLKELQSINHSPPAPQTTSTPVLHITSKPRLPLCGLHLQPYKTTTHSPKYIRQQWIQSATQPSLVQGNRSVVFFPVHTKCGVHIENENNSAYVSQAQHPKIDARFVARLRNKYHNTPVHMYDIVPHLETLYQAKQHKWKIQKTPYPLAPLRVIDMQKQSVTQNAIFLSAPLKNALQRTKPTDRVALFIHRRGLYSALVCRQCGYVPSCNQCSRALIQHTNELVCHICSQTYPVPLQCRQCGATRIKRLGGGTELVEKMLQRQFPHLSVARLDYDTASTHEKQKNIIDLYVKNKTNILLGTQTLLNAPNLPKFAWSGVVLLDTILNLPIHNATEQAFTAMWRLRAQTRREVFVQTYLPHLGVFSDAQKQSYEPFFKSQLALKKALYLPPFCQFIQITVRGRNKTQVARNATQLAHSLNRTIQKNNLKDIILLGPAPHYVHQQKGLYVWYLILKYPRATDGETRNIQVRDALLDLVPPQYDVCVDPITL